MTDVLTDFIDEPKKIKKLKNNIICCGLDIGTMNLVLSRSDLNEVKMTRNVFLPLKEDEVSITELSDISYVKEEDNIYVIGQDAFRLANIFGYKLSRPMSQGLISQKEINAIDVLTLMLKDLFGTTKDKEVYCSYSVPAEPIDSTRNVIYHEKVFARILGYLGVNYSPVNEAMAIIYSETSSNGFSGVGISFGAGCCNVCVSWKGVEVLKFSTSKSGDYIDNSVSESLAIVENRITSVKEKYLNLDGGFSNEKNKNRRRILECLVYYYESMMNYTISNIIDEFNDKVEIELEEPIPVIIAGGTSMPNGFVNLFKNILMKYDLPFEISEVRQAENPLTAVSKGLLIKTVSDVKDR